MAAANLDSFIEKYFGPINAGHVQAVIIPTSVVDRYDVSELLTKNVRRPTAAAIVVPREARDIVSLAKQLVPEMLTDARAKGWRQAVLADLPYVAASLPDDVWSDVRILVAGGETIASRRRGGDDLVDPEYYPGILRLEQGITLAVSDSPSDVLLASPKRSDGFLLVR
jgi:hypothetical protein